MAEFGMYNLFYMLALIGAELIHLHYSPRRSLFALRLILCISVLAGVSLAVPHFTGEWALLNSPARILLFAASVGMGLLCYRDTFFHIVNKCVFGLLTISCAFIWVWVLEGFFPPVAENEAAALAVSYVLNCGIFLFFSVFNHRRYAKSKAPRRFAVQLAVIETLAVLIFSVIGALPFGEGEYPASIFAFIIVYLCFGLLNVFSDEKRLNDEYNVLMQLQEKERQQYRTSKEYMELINVKSHDMKHLLVGLRERRADSAVAAELARIEQALNGYGAAIHTGNEALDIVLTEKARFCVKEDIQMTTIADGQAVSYMDSADIYSLLGNLLDNAIEALRRVKEKERRVLSVFVRRESGVVHIRTENYCAEAPEFADGMPVTKKTDRSSHGFGTKSIRMTAEQYGGVVQFTERDGFFIADVLLPLREGDAPGEAAADAK